jgi:hypothetical protein
MFCFTESNGSISVFIACNELKKRSLQSHRVERFEDKLYCSVFIMTILDFEQTNQLIVELSSSFKCIVARYL